MVYGLYGLIQMCVLLLIITILNFQISVLSLTASQAGFFLKCPYLRVWHDLKLPHILLLSSNLTCNTHYYKNSDIFVEKYFERLKLIPHLYKFMICSANFASQLTMSAE